MLRYTLYIKSKKAKTWTKKADFKYKRSAREFAKSIPFKYNYKIVEKK